MEPRTRTWLGIAILAFAMLGLAAAWKWTGLRAWADPDRLAALVEPLRTSWYALLVVVAVFVVAELFLFPVLVLVFVCGLAFGPVLGAVYALAGSIASAVLPFLLGRKLGRERLEKHGGKLVAKLASALERRGVVAVFVVRKIPAPYSLVNLVCGASPLSLRDFLLGTALGMGTGVILITVIGSQIGELVRSPEPATVATAVGLLIAPLALALVVQRALNRRVEESR